MRLLVDQDGVMADFMGRVFDITEQETGRRYCHADITDYWFDGCPDKDLFMDIMNREGLYRDLDVITGSVQAINRLREQYDVVVCSAPPKGSKTAEDEKREWLARHFDNDFAEAAIITRNKHLVMGSVLIEDNPHIRRDAAWTPVMLDQPWNSQAKHLYRMRNWGDTGIIYSLMDGVVKL